MAIAEKRAFFSGAWTGNVAFTTPASAAWLIQNLSRQISVIGTATELNIIHRDSSSVDKAHLHRDAAMVAKTFHSKLSAFEGLIMLENEELFLDPAAGSGTTLLIVLNYLEIT